MPHHPTSRLRRVTRRTAKWTCTILAGAMVIAWIGSRWQGIYWNHETGWPYFIVYSDWGAIYGRWSFEEALPPPPNRNRIQWEQPKSAFGWDNAWRWKPHFDKDWSGVTLFLIPLWIPTLLFALPAAILWRTDLRRRKADRVGLCPNCGYSLVGTPATSPCPECGTPHSVQTDDVARG